MTGEPGFQILRCVALSCPRNDRRHQTEDDPQRVSGDAAQPKGGPSDGVTTVGAGATPATVTIDGAC